MTIIMTHQIVSPNAGAASSPLVDQQPEAQSTAPEQSREVIISCENVHKTYLLGVEGIPALRGISLNVYKGEFLAIYGMSGGGKTSLLNILGTIDVPTKGNLQILGQRISQRTTDKDLALLRLKDIGFVFQTFNLLSTMTARENIEMPMILLGERTKEARQARVNYLLQAVGMSHRGDHFPSMLSGGEQQRITIARAIANVPSILLLDEPTGDLDTINTLIIMDLLVRLNGQGITCVMVTHDSNLKNYANRAVFICDGKLQREEHIPVDVRQAKIDLLQNTLARVSGGRVGGPDTTALLAVEKPGLLMTNANSSSQPVSADGAVAMTSPSPSASPAPPVVSPFRLTSDLPKVFGPTNNSTSPPLAMYSSCSSAAASPTRQGKTEQRVPQQYATHVVSANHHHHRRESSATRLFAQAFGTHNRGVGNGTAFNSTTMGNNHAAAQVRNRPMGESGPTESQNVIAVSNVSSPVAVAVFQTLPPPTDVSVNIPPPPPPSAQAMSPNTSNNLIGAPQPADTPLTNATAIVSVTSSGATTPISHSRTQSMVSQHGGGGGSSQYPQIPPPPSGGPSIALVSSASSVPATHSRQTSKESRTLSVVPDEPSPTNNTDLGDLV